METIGISGVIGVDERLVDAICENSSEHYRVYYLAAKSKRRRIEAPKRQLKLIQRSILDRVVYELTPTAHAHGFVRGRSIVTHARRHCRQELVVVTDIRDFFPSVGVAMVRDALSGLRLSAADTDRLVSLVTRQGHLPQGAPTSPHLANLVFREADRQIAAAARRRGWRYSRYADDLALSGRDDPGSLLSEVKVIVASNGFRLSSRKTRVMRRHQRQMVTGLVVNDRVALPAQKRRWLRAVIHRARTKGWDCVELANQWTVAGHLAYLRSVDPSLAESLADELCGLKSGTPHAVS